MERVGLGVGPGVGDGVGAGVTGSGVGFVSKKVRSGIEFPLTLCKNK